MEAECWLCAESLELQMKITYQAVFVRYVIGEFQFVEGDNFLHPLFPSGGAVGGNVHPLGHLRVRLASHNPSAVTNSSLLFMSNLSCKWQQKYTYCISV